MVLDGEIYRWYGMVHIIGKWFDVDAPEVSRWFGFETLEMSR